MKYAFAFLTTLLAATPAIAATKSFPGAEGFGSYTPGGRGGVVYVVSNLNDSGTGSLRACVEATGARTCVFTVSGLISTMKPIMARTPYLTIAGQTAPGDGIALRIAPNATDARTPLIVKNTHDVIVRYLRLRPGPSSNPTSSSAFLVEKSENVIVDHVSMSWAPDQNMSAYGDVKNLTVQWSIMSEGLMQHSKGALTCSDGPNCRELSLHHNLFAHNRDRNPDLKGSPLGQFDFVNNVAYNPMSAFVEVWTPNGGLRVNVVGNTFVRGPKTSGNAYAVRYNTPGATGNPLVFMKDNSSTLTLSSPNLKPFLSTLPIGTVSSKVDTAAIAYKAVLAKAGAWPRDSVDKRVVKDVGAYTGKLITNPSEVGGWPVLKSTAAPVDADKDGMPDAWETSKGLNPTNAADRNLDRDLDGFTELEEYLDERARQLTPI